MLPVIFGLLFVGLFAMLWLGSVYLQGWLYNDVAGKMPLRAAGGALVMAGFLTGWCAIYKADPGRFDTLINFSREKTEGIYTEFESVRKVGAAERPPVKFVRSAEGRGATTEFQTTDGQKKWSRSDSDGLVVAILIKEKDQAEPTRFDAQLTPDGKFPAEALKYQQAKTTKYLDEVALGTVQRVRSWGLIGNLFANFLHAALWCAVFCLIMRFEIGNAVAIGLGFWAVTMLAVQPALFSYVTKGIGT